MTDGLGQAMTLDEVAVILNCSTRTVRREIDAGRLASMKFGGRRRVLAADVQTYISLHRPAEDQGRAAALLPEHIHDRACVMTCGLRPDGEGGGVAMFSLTGMSLSRACPHILNLLGRKFDELAGGGWRLLRDNRDELTATLLSHRAQGVRHLVVDYPLQTASGKIEPFDILNDPVVDAAGQVLMYLAIAVPPGSEWRKVLPPNRVVDAHSQG